METESVKRLRSIFREVQDAMNEITVRNGVTPPELFAVVGWIQQTVESGEFPLAAQMLFGIPLMNHASGMVYADPASDGASPWFERGPAYVDDAPPVANPGVLPMREDEPGEALFISGVVRSTDGSPLPGAVIDVWLNDNDGRYGGLDTGDAGGMPYTFMPYITDNQAPKFNLRGKITADQDGRYAYRAVMPGPETLVLDDSLFGRTLKLLDIANSRPLHVHALVNADGHHELSHQIFFDIDPLVHHSSEGRLTPSSIFETKRRTGPVPFGPPTSDGSYYEVECDYVLRPIQPVTR